VKINYFFFECLNIINVREIKYNEKIQMIHQQNFFLYMDNLVSHKTISKIEAIEMITIYYS
jgi:hypothetical protein